MTSRLHALFAAVLLCFLRGGMGAQTVPVFGVAPPHRGAPATMTPAGGDADVMPAPRNRINVHFVPAPELRFPSRADSNSPAVWDGESFYIFNSAGAPRRGRGTRLEDAQDVPDQTGQSSRFDNDIHSLRWLEAVIRDDTGRFYAWYHNEIPVQCPQGIRFYPIIGAALSDNDGALWEDLGIILTPRPGSITCDTAHIYTSGGIGDFSVILDCNADRSGDHYLYFLFSSYGGELEEQGVSFARMLWIDRDRPLDRYSGQSKAVKWYRDGWIQPGIGGYSTGIFDDRQKVSWTRIDNNGYWGPSVHWNVDLKKFILLMSRSKGGNYESGGIFMSYTENMAEPRSWAQPKKIIEGEGLMWYPQVIGDTGIRGTDKLAGWSARYFNFGTSDALIVFGDDDTPHRRIPSSSGLRPSCWQGASALSNSAVRRRVRR
jgi:hypothetical protein